jgi:multidrug efflux pump subunit AcrA (membrane-fusion protein)
VIRIHAAAALAVALLVTAVSCDRQERSAASTGRPVAAGRAVDGVPASLEARRGEEIPLEEARLTVEYRSVSVGGRLQPRSRVVHEVISDGYILTVDVREGQRVSAGQRLFSIDKDELIGRYRPVVVSSRIAGLVSAVEIREKDEVKAGQGAVTVVGQDGYTLEATVSDKDAFKLAVGQMVEGRTTAGRRVRGRLTYRSLEPDYQTGLFSLEFDFLDVGELHVGEYVLLELPVERTEGIFVRRELVARRYGRYYLWVVGVGDVLEAREITPGPSFGDRVLIAGGLSPGERYLSELSGREREGQRVGGR